MREYNSQFLNYGKLIGTQSACAIVPIVNSILQPTSVLDVGCGQGAWLKVWKDNGITDVVGIDGDYVDRLNLVIDEAEFQAWDLRSKIDRQRRFDLVENLEVAEHLPASRAQSFVEDLCRHGDLVLFSAAPPGQGGEQHINEQPYAYWRTLFQKYGYEPFDCVRPLIANAHHIAPWYRYNLLLYVQQEAFSKLPDSVRQTHITKGVPIQDISPLLYKARKNIISRLPHWATRILADIAKKYLANAHAQNHRKKLWNREDVQFIAHAGTLLLLLIAVRPIFIRTTPAAIYEGPNIFWGILKSDYRLLLHGARRYVPVVPQLLILFVPTAIILLTGIKLRWNRWENGTALRNLIMTLLIMLGWASSTFDYNIYLNQGHFFDRFLIVLFVALSWKYPLAVPFAVQWIYVMLKESYIPIIADDFDFRAVHEFLVVFSLFIWLSARKSFKSEHFLLVGIGAWASYYFTAGMSKLFYGPDWSWLLDNHLSNLAVGGHIRGWLGFLSHDTFLKFAHFARKLDFPLAVFTLVFELGAVAAFFLHRRIAQVWFAFAIAFNAGIFFMTGIFFWKWLVTNIAFLVFTTRGGAPIYNRMCKHWPVITCAIIAVFYSRYRTYYNPQTGVAWYDTPMVENYTIHAIGQSDHDYLVSPSFLEPMTMHFVQGRLCYATDERTISGIYGVTGSYNNMKALENLRRPEDALKLLARGGKCTNPRQRKVYEDFMVRYFGNLNKYGRPHRWLSWIGRPQHLWVQQQGDLYDMQEPVKKIELRREVVVHQGGKLHGFGPKTVNTLSIPIPNQ